MASFGRYPHSDSEDSLDGDETVRLQDLCQRDLANWGVKSYRVYCAEEDGKDLELLWEKPSAYAPASRKNQRDGLSQSGAERQPFAASNFWSQTLIICESTEIDNFPKEGAASVPDLEMDVRAYFQKNAEARKLQADGTVKNLWRFDDCCFQFPFAILDNGSLPKLRREDYFWYFNPHDREKRGDSSPSLPPTTTDLKDGLWFIRAAVTICVRGFLDQRTVPRPQDKNCSGINLSKEWIALVIAPRYMFQPGEYGGSIDEDFLRRKLPAGPQNGQAGSKLVWRRNQNADFFQGRLVEICFRKAMEVWKDQNKRINDACDVLTKKLDNEMHNQAFWRRNVQYTLTDASKMAEGLELLSESISEVIHDEDNVWWGFRNAKLRARMGQLEEDLEKAGDKDKPLKRGEYRRMKHLLWGILDRERDGLLKIRASLEAKQKAMSNLRQLLVDLSQTRASLYANQLGDHVRGLTYVSIIFLPLSFVVALWSMNYDIHSETAFIVTVTSTALATVVGVIFIVALFALESL